MEGNGVQGNGGIAIASTLAIVIALAIAAWQVISQIATQPIPGK